MPQPDMICTCGSPWSQVVEIVACLAIITLAYVLLPLYRASNLLPASVAPLHCLFLGRVPIVLLLMLDWMAGCIDGSSRQRMMTPVLLFLLPGTSVLLLLPGA
jgi:hypothetical protein